MSAFEADRFNHSRTSPENQLSVPSCQWPVKALNPVASCWFLVARREPRTANDQQPTTNDASEKTPAGSPPNVRRVRRPGCPSDDSDWGDSPPAEANGWRQRSEE